MSTRYRYGALDERPQFWPDQKNLKSSGAGRVTDD
jgi:hypothetical protein